MLKNIPPLLTPDALFALASMGHGDEIAIVDANFPAASVARQGGARLVYLPGSSAAQALTAVLQLMPLDRFVSNPACTMQVVGDAVTVPEAVAEFAALLQSAGEQPPAALERFAFYRQATSAFAIIQTGEQRKYGNIILKKGIIALDGNGPGA